ncbi:SPOR domain-containing protein [Pseudochrobactrum sp. MP213Fo]|uniref:SPOR domain-containing protein n=1 Tax=Pseudochrobactrum sp. MP213Fo TaxID=3022250 RepID=UPI003BA038D0
MYHAFRHAASGIKIAARSLLAITRRGLTVTMVGALTVSAATGAADAAKNPSRHAAIVIDANTGKTLFAESADAKRFPASLTKMMTLYMVFEAMQAGRINKNTKIPFSKYAATRPPTKIGVAAGQSIVVEDAIMALITRSANDAAAALGEYLGGSEARFAQMMTAKARRLGMRSTTFRNASGLPNASQQTTARDMAILGIALRQHFPQQYPYFGRSSFQFRGKTINGHNRLLGRIEGVDGIKTGYVNASGYNLVTSVNRDGRRIVAVVMGGATGGARDAEMARLIQTHLPKATPSRRGSDALLVARNDAPVSEVVVASAPSPLPRAIPLPQRRIEQQVQVADASDSIGSAQDAISAVIARQKPIPAQQPEMLALASPTPRPAANVASSQLVAIPTPKASIPNVDPVITASANTAAARMGVIQVPTPEANIAPANTPVAVASNNAASEVSGDWAIQIGSLPSEGQAQDMLNKAAQQAGKTLRATSPMTETFNKGNNTFYRARFVGFETKTAAWDACAALKKKSFNCYAIAR